MQVLLDLNDMQESLKSNGYTNRKLATRFKVTHTTVNSYFKKQDKFDFMHLVDALRLYKPKDVEFRRNCIKEYIPRLSHKNLKLALEVLDMFGEYELQELVIEQIMKSQTKKGDSPTVRTNVKIAEYYKLLRKRSEGTIIAREFFNEVQKKKESQKNIDNDLMIVSDFSVMYSYLDFSNYEKVNECIESVLPRIENVAKHTNRNSFLLRVKEMQVPIHLHNNGDLNKAREVCFEILNDPFNYYMSTKAIAYCKLGESYALSEYETAKKYICKALELIGVPVNKKFEIRRNKILNVLLFLKIHHGKELDSIDRTKLDLAELAFFYIKLGKKEEALEILKGLEKQNGSLSAFQLYYMGLATEDRKYFEKSIESFTKTGDFFYISLPINALKCYNQII
ncbi:AimR family lysis-lysogeny pheromone receptor [Bacillus pacificus]|uniref:AimR family lysis-lysogeny pheromone receptor n=1 Tax=Bacillus pacificus TaxID=2026187 RepID=UPI0009356960|nr:AimR family lysis-lysogeny pheromone receptor [Bacillus pacificus]MCC2351995.1 AimR family lysis-lysogeny pheromone receptor [Bacillus pacificus]MCU5247342.1 AimR family lysis-lysogeny pheromone receptor [Bacillus pacificus]MCU5467444.1 AimR family lysis-lysogeny pheromone receptor [Bacillus pacificus]